MAGQEDYGDLGGEEPGGGAGLGGELVGAGWGVGQDEGEEPALLVAGGLRARVGVALGAGGGQVVQVTEDGLADPAELAVVEAGAGLAQPAPGHPRADPQRVLQSVEGAALVRGRAADDPEFFQDGLHRAVRLGDVPDEAGHGGGHRVGQALLAVGKRRTGVRPRRRAL